MNKKHNLTPGPWTVDQHARFGWNVRGHRERHLGAGTLICDLRGYDAEADARHIVAAVNACAEIPTEALEAGALKELIDALEWVLNPPDDCARCTRVGGPCVGHAALAKVRP